MGFEINQAHVAQYSSNVRNLAEETRAPLRQVCELKGVNGAVFFGDRLTGSNTVRRTGRHTANPSTPPLHDRRRGWTVDDEWGAYIDKADEIRTIIDFKGKYPTLCVNAFNRSEKKTAAEFAVALPSGDFKARDLETGEKVAAAARGGRLVLTKVMEPGAVWVVALEKP